MQRTKNRQGVITETMTWEGTEFITAGSLTNVYDRPVTVALRGVGETHLGDEKSAVCGTNFRKVARPASLEGAEITCKKCLKIIEATELVDDEPAPTQDVQEAAPAAKETAVKVGAGDLVEAEVCSTHPRTITVLVDREPWSIEADRTGRDRMVLTNRCGPEAVYTDSLRVVPRDTPEGAVWYALAARRLKWEVLPQVERRARELALLDAAGRVLGVDRGKVLGVRYGSAVATALHGVLHVEAHRAPDEAQVLAEVRQVLERAGWTVLDSGTHLTAAPA
ncbi:hypothetical protein [Streptomyces sp. TRM68367]|uniref:hypothetical protein n=1 Tax=Streptomyces sp. TRM68367 TaxID=2758415 RepID=UPI00165C1842|nr:hypothetical protein [Streptomyces sp. TRM68367]MBC9731226.1 hypothetical protein [Streptomyces sp. TRM68367]